MFSLIPVLVIGALWFTNLMAADSTLLLPVLSSMTWLWTMEVLRFALMHPQRWAEFTAMCSHVILNLSFVLQLGGGTLYLTWPGLRTLVRTIAMASIPGQDVQQTSAVLFSDSQTAATFSRFSLCACCSGFYLAGRSVHVLDPGQPVCCGKILHHPIQQNSSMASYANR